MRKSWCMLNGTFVTTDCNVGRPSIVHVSRPFRVALSGIKTGTFDGLGDETKEISLFDPESNTLSSDVLQGAGDVEKVTNIDCQLESLPADAFQALPLLEELVVYHNVLTSLPSTILKGLTSLSTCLTTNRQACPVPFSRGLICTT